MKVGFIGSGEMARALCRGFIASALVTPSDVLASDVSRSQLTHMREMGVITTTSNREVVQKNEVIYVSVKPNIISNVLRNISTAVTREKLVISVAAGINTKFIEQSLPEDVRVIRVMPNIAAVVQSSACVFTRGQRADDSDSELVREMLSSVGMVEEVAEEHMDAVTGLSGNGPSYGLIAIQAMADGGVKMGLNREQATRLAAQALLGSSKLVLSSRRHPEELKDEVCSPGGTTIHAVHRLENAGFRGALMDAVEAGAKRAMEIGKLQTNGADHITYDKNSSEY